MNLKAAPEKPKRGAHNENPPINDFSVERNGERCAGVHLIVDVYGAKGLDSSKLIKETLLRCVEVADATLLHLHLHDFESSGGISGVAVLAESHISIHTWPEHDFAAIDVFMCGNTKPDACLKILNDAFSPASVLVTEFLRGRLWRDHP